MKMCVSDNSVHENFTVVNNSDGCLIKIWNQALIERTGERKELIEISNNTIKKYMQIALRINELTQPYLQFIFIALKCHRS